MKIRFAQKKDAGQLLEIYAPFISHSAVSFESEVPSVREFEERMKSYMQTYPWLVCEQDNEIIGYAYASRYRDRKAYQWSCECSVYVKKKFRKSGIARMLYTVLFETLKRQGFMNVYAVITFPNPASIRFHRKAGFRKFAVYKKVGYKMGKWNDVHWYGKQLLKPVVKPKMPAPFAEIKNSLAVKEILKRKL